MTADQASDRPFASKPEVEDALMVAIGRDAALELAHLAQEMARVGSSLPARTGAFGLVEIEVEASAEISGSTDISRRLGTPPAGRQWSYWTARRDDGQRVLLASTAYRPGVVDGRSGVSRFLLADLHSRLAAWYVSHAWRAADLFACASDELIQRRLIPAAAATRALLEGVAAFVVEGNALMEEWLTFKQAGPPSHDALANFRARFHNALAQPQFGTRTGDRTKAEDRLGRTNVLTLLTKFIERYANDDSLWESYDWLCDAVHPSFGSHFSYWVAYGHGRGTSTVIWNMERELSFDPQPGADFENPVRNAVLRTLRTSVNQLVVQSARLRWFVFDLGLTSEASTATIDRYWGSTEPLGRNELCPCGSGLRSKRCVHTWGAAARGLPEG